MTAAPSWIETTAKFDFPDLCQLQVQPSHELSSSTTNVLLQLSRGAHYAWAKVLHHHNDHHTLRLGTAQASALVRLPLASLAAVRISPTWNSNNNNNNNNNSNVVAPHHRRGEITCDVEAVTGGPGRTRAVLHLEYEHPTLAVQYQPTPRHLIRPVLDLFSGKMVYQWILALQKGGSLQVLVDPERDVTMQWNDPSSSNRGVWLTNVRVPLEQPWRVDVRVRRQFAF